MFEGQRLLEIHTTLNRKGQQERSASPTDLQRIDNRRPHIRAARAQAGEHAHCGRGVLASRFSYEAGAFAAAGVEVAAVGWRDMGVPTLIALVRRRRPGALQTPQQERFVDVFACYVRHLRCAPSRVSSSCCR